jgi:hypothetical protein
MTPGHPLTSITRISTTTAGSTDQSGWSRPWNTSKPITLHSHPRYSPYESGTKPGALHQGPAIANANWSRSLLIRTQPNGSPASVIRATTDRRRCRSIPTNCLPSYASFTRGLLRRTEM